MMRKDTAVITGAPVRQPFSHESNIYMKTTWLHYDIFCNLSVLLPGINQVTRANHQYSRFPPPPPLYLPCQTYKYATHTQLINFISGTATSPCVILSDAAVIIFRVHVTLNRDHSTMINTSCGLAIAVCVCKEWNSPHVFFLLRVSEVCVCVLLSFSCCPGGTNASKF